MQEMATFIAARETISAIHHHSGLSGPVDNEVLRAAQTS